MNGELGRVRGATIGPVLVGGFGATVAMACVWFVTHLPWFGLAEQVAIPVVLVAWLAALCAGAARVPRPRAIGVGIGAGFVSGLAGLVFFGSQLAKPANDAGATAGVVPQAPL